MAEALLRLIAGNHFEAESAGIHPAGLHPLTVEVMQEIGVNIRHHRSKSVEEFLGQYFTYVITVCDRATEPCPIFPAIQFRHWPFENPAAAPIEIRLEAFRRVRDEITDWLCRFLIKDVGLTPAALKCARCGGVAF